MRHRPIDTPELRLFFGGYGSSESGFSGSGISESGIAEPAISESAISESGIQPERASVALLPR